MSETQGSSDDSSTSSDVVDSVSQDLNRAASFTILIHGVGAEKAKDLLAAARTGYLASHFSDRVFQKTLSECPTLSQKNEAEAILILGQNGDHYVIALPWNNRPRLASLARKCLSVLALLMTMTAAAYVLDNILFAVVDNIPSVNLHGAGSFVLSKVAVKIFGSIGRWQVIGILLFGIFSFAQWTFTWWTPWLWVLACFLVVVTGTIAIRTIIRCVPIAGTKGWALILWMLVAAVAFSSLASVHTMSVISQRISTDNLKRPRLADLDRTAAIERRVQDLNVSKILPPALTQDIRPVKGSDSTNKLGPKIEEILHSDFVTCLSFILICIVGIIFTRMCGWVLDFGLDVLNYGDDEKGNAMMFGRLSEAIRWLHSQAPNAHVTVVAHSLGSVIAAQALSSMSNSEPLLNQVTLITLGSPLNYLYRMFPNVSSSPRELSATICSKARWINLWRRSDIIGRELDVVPGVLVQYCIGAGGHSDYWTDGAVWKAVAHESLNVGNPPHREPARSFVEVHLGLITTLAIVVLVYFGIVLCYRPNLDYLLAISAMLLFIVISGTKKAVSWFQTRQTIQRAEPGNDS